MKIIGILFTMVFTCVLSALCFENTKEIENSFLKNNIKKPSRNLEKRERLSRLSRYSCDDLVAFTKQIEIPGFPLAFNPSILRTKEGLVMVFRYAPDRRYEWNSYIGVVELNENLELASEPTLLDTRFGNRIIPSQSEDARMILYKDEIYLTYNDSEVARWPTDTQSHKRDMYIAKLVKRDGNWELETATKLFHETDERLWQKNWIPFIWNQQMLLVYTTTPFEVVRPNLSHGDCRIFSRTMPKIRWDFGEPRGGTPALPIDGKYLSFFHSSKPMMSKVAKKNYLQHFYMGAYLFDATPPFAISHITPFPILAKEFYTDSEVDKRVVFPGGFVEAGPYFYVIYGKDDREIWIAAVDKKKLLASMVRVKS